MGQVQSGTKISQILSKIKNWNVFYGSHPSLRFDLIGLQNSVFLETTECVGKVSAHSGQVAAVRKIPVWTQKGHLSNAEGVTKQTSRDLMKMWTGLGRGREGDAQSCLLLQHLQSSFPLPVPPITGSAHHAAETSCSLFLIHPYLCRFHFSFWILIQAAHWPLSGLPDSIYVLLCNPRALRTFRIANPCCSGAFAFVTICIPHFIG